MRSSEFVWNGETAIAGWGYTDNMDGTSGEQPRGTLIENNFCHELGHFEKQSSCWFQAKTALTVLKNNIMFNGPRALINFSKWPHANRTLHAPRCTHHAPRTTLRGCLA